MRPALLLLFGSTAAAAAATRTETATLRCGHAELRLTSTVLPGRTAPPPPLAQHLTRSVGTARLPVPLEPATSVPLDGHRVADRYVASWACLSAAGGTHDVLLGYACAVDPGQARGCGGDKEWFRVLGADGGFLDAGVPHDGPARQRLSERLGLADALAAGVPMTATLSPSDPARTR